MKRIKQTNIRLILLILLAICLPSEWIFPCLPSVLTQVSANEKHNGRYSSSQLKNNKIVSDFDGDNRPDIVTSRFDGNAYKIEFHFSSSNETTLISLASNISGLSIFAFDVDLDNDND